MELLVVVLWAVLSFAVGLLAKRYGRFGPGWFVFALIFSPLIGFVLLAAAGPKR